MTATAKTRMELIHDFLFEAEQEVVHFPALVSSIIGNTPLPTVFSRLEPYREELADAYKVFLLLSRLIKALEAAPA